MAWVDLLPFLYASMGALIGVVPAYFIQKKHISHSFRMQRQKLIFDKIKIDAIEGYKEVMKLGFMYQHLTLKNWRLQKTTELYNTEVSNGIKFSELPEDLKVDIIFHLPDEYSAQYMCKELDEENLEVGRLLATKLSKSLVDSNELNDKYMSSLFLHTLYIKNEIIDLMNEFLNVLDGINYYDLPTDEKKEEYLDKKIRPLREKIIRLMKKEIRQKR